MKKSTLLFCLLIAATTVFAQGSRLAKVFVLGEGEERYEQLTTTYTQTLLGACNNDIQVAFDHWLGMMRAIDAYSEQINYNLKGVKLWMQVFWAEDGSIDHLGYLPRPDSRLVDTAELTAFLASFVGQYRFPVTSERKYSHYTGATFPTLSERAE